MDRLKILVLNKPGGVYNEYVDVPSVIGFLQRTGRPNNFMIVAYKGKKSLVIEKIDFATIQKELMDFQVKP